MTKKMRKQTYQYRCSGERALTVQENNIEMYILI